LHNTPPPQAPKANPAPTARDRAPARRVALVGFGTVGRAVAKILGQRKDGLLRLTHVCNRNVERKKQAWGTELSIPSDVIWTDDLQAILDSDADIVVELIGGLHPAEDLVRGALNAGMSVVTANKQLIARHGPDLLQLAGATGCQLEYGASVAGGVPVLPALRTGLCGDRLHGIAGILNGTCNYILSRIETARIPFSEALEEAQALGYAEADASEDLDGGDARATSSHSPDCRSALRQPTFARAPFVPSMPSILITPPNWAALSARFRVPT
jgi:homoserine dehydrogenase